MIVNPNTTYAQPSTNAECLLHDVVMPRQSVRRDEQSHMLGGFVGRQAEYVSVPFADVGPIKIPPGLSDEQVLFLSIFPTGYMGAENCGIERGDTIAV